MRPSTGKQHDAQLTVPLPSVTIQLGMSQGVKGLGAEIPRDAWHHGEKGDAHFPTNPRGIHSGRSPQTNQIPRWDNAGPHTLQPRLKMLQRAKILCLEEEKPSAKKNRWHCLPQQPPSKLKAAGKENQAPPGTLLSTRAIPTPELPGVSWSSLTVQPQIKSSTNTDCFHGALGNQRPFSQPGK